MYNSNTVKSTGYVSSFTNVCFSIFNEVKKQKQKQNKKYKKSNTRRHFVQCVDQYIKVNQSTRN